MEAKIDNYFTKENDDGKDIQDIDDVTAKRLRSDGSSTGDSELPSSKKLALDTDETLLLPNDAPFWVPTLFKAIDKLQISVHVMSQRLEAFKNDVDNKLTDIKADTNSKISNLEKKFNEKSEEQQMTISELTDSVQFMSNNFEEQKSINEGLLTRIQLIEDHHQKIKEKCHEYEEMMVVQSLHIDSLEQYSRRNCVLLHGVPETADEVTDTLATETINNNLEMNIKAKDLDRTHRIGRKREDKIRPIIIKFARYNKRKQVFKNKKKFKGTAFMMTESLTEKRMKQLNSGKDRFGKENVLSGDGEILIKQGKKIVNINTL